MIAGALKTYCYNYTRTTCRNLKYLGLTGVYDLFNATSVYVFRVTFITYILFPIRDNKYLEGLEDRAKNLKTVSIQMTFKTI
jgi:hypothetical protein